MGASVELQWVLGGTIAVYVIGLYALGWWARRRISDTEDFIVAGRRLPLSLAWATLLATWFGAGTMLVAADEVRRGGLQRAALDPFGAGLCLLLAGMFFAGPLWRMGLLTLSDFFRQRFGSRAEWVSALILIPSYFGWIAAQFVALGSLLELLFGIDLELAILLVALVGTGYTLLGGMWSVTLTDAAQVGFVIGGLGWLTFRVLQTLGGGDPGAGLGRIGAESPAGHLTPWPTGSGTELLAWLGVLCVGALGNIPGQDLMQRVFSANSAKTARHACLLAGVAYLILGAFPLLLALAAPLLLPEARETAILPALAGLFLEPVPLVILTLALVSAVLSTIDSAILSPASVLAQNILGRLTGNASLTLTRVSVVIVAAAILLFAYLGESAYSLLESSYELTMVGLFASLALALHRPPRWPGAGMAAMLAGTGTWLLHGLAGWDSFASPLLGETLPVSLGSTAISFLSYLAWEHRGGVLPTTEPETTD